MAALEGLSLAAGMVVTEVLRSLGCSEVQLKWPNDMLVNSEKIGGILLEMTGDPSDQCQVVLGVGVNTRLGLDDSECIDQAYTTLEEYGITISRNNLVAKLIASLLRMLSQFSLQGFRAFHSRWKDYDACGNKQVYIKAGNEITYGTAKGVDKTGGLLLETAEGIRVFKGGELSLRVV